MVAKLPEEEHPKQAFGWAARDESGVLSPFNFSRRATGEKDVCFKVLYCGMCHSDLHMVKNEWGTSTYPLVPGNDTHYGAKYYDGTITYGGYSDIMVADEHFIVRIPDTLPLDSTAPLLCAGITVYSPLKYYGLDKPGMHVGVVGLGGLGHMAVKFAKGMGVKVTVISTSPSKKQEAVEHLGADSFLVSRDQDQMKATMGTMDGIIDTVSATHPLVPLIGLLKTNGKLILVGAPEKPLELAAFPLLMDLNPTFDNPTINANLNTVTSLLFKPSGSCIDQNPFTNDPSNSSSLVISSGIAEYIVKENSGGEGCSLDGRHLYYKRKTPEDEQLGAKLVLTLEVAPAMHQPSSVAASGLGADVGPRDIHQTIGVAREAQQSQRNIRLRTAPEDEQLEAAPVMHQASSVVASGLRAGA
ncbi:hypothetical protein GH714_014390 [Hevea brasiliensis]|uniref:Alcohol dehydrogenase-like C-terminal domain-containing protein n=1 Tax=Hevea brasiliensis TaxID=3981 RepID=A0A6A6KR46_HEVBR|nr:hypothetical protein GH714_014390 [Hevea brasiliensis]